MKRRNLPFFTYHKKIINTHEITTCIFMYRELMFCKQLSLNAQESWQSRLVIQDESGNLTYKKDNDGFVIPDFSQAGYGNGKDIPVVSLPERTITISPLEDKEADNTQHIQKAIDEVGKYALDAEGIRGVVLLKAGRYNVDGTLI